MRGYKLKRPNDQWLKLPITDEDDLDAAIHRRMSHVDGKVHLSQDGDKWGPFINRGTGTQRLLTKVKAADVGHGFRLWNSAQKGVQVRVVEVKAPAANTGGSPGVDLLVGFLNKNFKGEWASLGIYVYKNIAGTTTFSDHAYVGSGWCGRAIDVHPATTTIGDEIQAAATAEPTIMAHLRYVLWRGVPGHYPGHLHFSFEDGGAPGSCG